MKKRPKLLRCQSNIYTTPKEICAGSCDKHNATPMVLRCQNNIHPTPKEICGGAWDKLQSDLNNTIRFI